MAEEKDKDEIKMVKVINRQGERQFLPLREGQNVKDLVRTLPQQAGFEWVVQSDNVGMQTSIVEATKDKWGGVKSGRDKRDILLIPSFLKRRK